jgi:membrane associated rhomboid family serine protease
MRVMRVMRGEAPRWTIAIACAAIAATAAALSHDPASRALAQALVADHRVQTETWRIFTGPLVHATWGHLVRDVSLVLVLGFRYEARLRARWPLIVAVGLAAPPLAVLAAGADGYLGLSGFAYALIAAALAFELRTRPRMWVASLAWLLAVKVVYEAIVPSASGLSILPRSAWLALGPGVHQAPLAHLAGAIAGALVVVVSQSQRVAPIASSSFQPGTAADARVTRTATTG